MSFVGNHVMSSSSISETNGGNSFNRPTTSSGFECKKKKWDCKLHTLVKNLTGQSDSDYWLVCWKFGKKSPRFVSSNSEDQRYHDI
jgi:hypothetical protein